MTKIKLFLKDFFGDFSGNYFPRIKSHFILAHEGKEDLDIVLWVWGGAAYIIAFFIGKLLSLMSLMIVKWVIAIFVIIYFIWHIRAIIKCSPKKIPLTPEQKEQLKKDRPKRIMRKLLLKESFGSWNKGKTAIVIDVYAILCFMGF